VEKIEFADIVRACLRTVPGAADALRKVPEPQRSAFEAWPEAGTDLFDFLPTAFVQPVLLPKLSEEPADEETLRACFAFIEGLARNPHPHIQNALCFEVYEQFLDSSAILLRAVRLCGPVAGAALRKMLTESCPATWERISGESA
jgi:hypothetical protein